MRCPLCSRCSSNCIRVHFISVRLAFDSLLLSAHRFFCIRATPLKWRHACAMVCVCVCECTLCSHNEMLHSFEPSTGSISFTIALYFSGFRHKSSVGLWMHSSRIAYGLQSGTLHRRRRDTQRQHKHVTFCFDSSSATAAAVEANQRRYWSAFLRLNAFNDKL